MADWQIVRLGSVAEFRNGINFTKENFGKGIKVINVKDFQDYSVPIYDDLSEINPDGVVRDEAFLHKNDIIFVRSNGNRELIGRSLFIDREPPKPITHSAFTIRVRFTSSQVLPQYYSYLFRSDLIRQVLSAYGSGTNISNLNQQILENLEVPLPPLTTQDRITAILSAYDDLIENNTRRIKLLEQAARDLYREWFVHFHFPGHENVPMIDSSLEYGAIPEGWEHKNLCSIADLTYGYPFSSNLFTEEPTGKPVIRIRDILNGASKTFTDEFADEKYIVRDGDLIIGMDGDFHMGKWAAGEAYLNQRVVRFRPKSDLSPYHLFLALETPIQRLNSTIVGTTVAHLGDSHLRTINIVIPPTEILFHASNIFNNLFELELNLRRRNANLRETRDLLLSRLVSGELDVSELEIEVMEN